MRALDRTFGEWVERSSAEAGEWLASVLAHTPGNAQTDRLVALMINLGSEPRSNPATALQWTNLISDPDTRRASEEKVVLRWGHQDRAAAIDYLGKSPTISPDRKQALLQTIASAGYPDTAD
jgi:anti-sigma factor ChrR (cupin superfamily)